NKAAKTDTTKGSAANAGQGASSAGQAPGVAEANAPVSLKTYSNYDFVPGDQIIFEDNFVEDADGEFPAHWNLEKGQAIVNKIAGAQAFCLTEGNYAEVNPRMKTPDYLPENFTIEFDFYPTDGAYPPGLLFATSTEGSGYIFFGKE